MMLAAELSRHATDEGRRWSKTLAPLRKCIRYPVFGFPSEGDLSHSCRDAFQQRIRSHACHRVLGGGGGQCAQASASNKALAWYGNDRNCQAWEPSGDDFLSSALMEAECMRRARGVNQFQTSMDEFLPGIAKREPATLFEPATVSDRSDGKIAHLDGLNLSRAWCWRSLALAWSDKDPRTCNCIGCGKCAFRGEHAPCGRRLHGRALAGDVCAACPAFDADT